jgi:hypothetical protein
LETGQKTELRRQRSALDCIAIEEEILTLSLLMPRYLAQPFNVIKWQLKFNPAA